MRKYVATQKPGYENLEIYYGDTLNRYKNMEELDIFIQNNFKSLTFELWEEIRAIKDLRNTEQHPNEKFLKDNIDLMYTYESPDNKTEIDFAFESMFTYLYEILPPRKDLKIEEAKERIV